MCKREIDEFREKLENHMKENNMEENIRFIADETIINALNNNRSVEDVAWAISQ